MAAGQRGQRRDRAVPVAARLVGVDRRGVDEFAGAVDDRHLDAGTQARVEAHRRARSGRCRQQQILQVVAEDADRLLFGAFAQGREQLQFEMQRELDPPGPAHRFAQPAIGRAAVVANAETARDARFARVRCRRCAAIGRVAVEAQREPQDAFVASAQHRQRPMRRHPRPGFAKVEPVAELGAFVLLAVDHSRNQHAVLGQIAAQAGEQGSVFGEALHQDLAGAVEHGLDVVEAGLGIDEGGRFAFRVEIGVGQQAVGQRFDAGLAGDHRLGAPLLAIRQVKVLERLLGVGCAQRLLEGGVELALLAHRLDHRNAAVLEFA